MSLSDLASLGSFVSGIAVLASLVYLTLQVRQAERYQKAGVQQGRAARLVDTFLRLADSAMVNAYDKGADGDPDISATQLGQYRFFMRAAMFNVEDTFHQHKAGLIDDDVFAGTCSNIRTNAARPGWRAMWKQIRVSWGTEFRDFIDQIVVETPVATPADQLAVWLAAVALERGEKP
jgi:hypothetical protein